MAKIILTTGGTGGHIFPALAVAEALGRRDPGAELLFIGSNYGPESELVQKAGLSFLGLPVRGFLGRGWRAVPAAAAMAKAFGLAHARIRAFRPDVIAGFGGYASFAPMLAGRVLGLPLLLHEQNALAGASNRFLARFAARVCVSLPNTSGFSRPCLLTGNPVRAAIARLGKNRRPSGEKRLLVLGGSQGAHALNIFMTHVLEKFGNKAIKVWHQCGNKDMEATRAAYESAGALPWRLDAFIDDMASAYEWADLAFCRSGASTVAELCAAALPAVFCPFPAAIHDHQTKNAGAMAAAGAGLLEPESGLDASRTGDLIAELLGNETKLAEMSAAALALARPDAADRLAGEIENLAHANKGR